MFDIWSASKTNSVIGDHYYLTKRLAGGGFSDVWLAFDERLKVNVVLKIFTSNQELDEQGLEMFRKEFAIVCNLSHSNILKPFTLDIISGTPCLVLPYCERGSAQKLVGKISEDELWIFVEQVASGLAYLHKHNIIHQDIKPGNVLIDADGQYLITDFGISTGMRNTMRLSGSKDYGNGELGTIAYMSYECACSKPVNSLSRDVWALGATVYELAFGDVPFGEYGGLAQKSEGGNAPSFAPGVISDDMKQLICKCLEFNTWDRPSANDVVEMINRHKTSFKENNEKKHSKVSPRLYLSASVLVAVMALFLTGIFKHIPAPIIANPNDSILIDVFNEVSKIVQIEGEKLDKLTIDENILVDASVRLKEAMSQDVTDTLSLRIADAWKTSQIVIDESFDAFLSAANEYGSINATSAQTMFLEKSRKLEPFISKNIDYKPLKQTVDGIITKLEIQ